jgi:hypothetical protein
VVVVIKFMEGKSTQGEGGQEHARRGRPTARKEGEAKSTHVLAAAHSVLFSLIFNKLSLCDNTGEENAKM